MTDFYHDLPQEMVYEILTKLPYTELLRVRQVCSDWKVLIDFIAKYISWRKLGSDIDLILHNENDENDDVEEGEVSYKWHIYPLAFKLDE